MNFQTKTFYSYVTPVFVLYFWSSKFWPGLETDLLKCFTCQIRNPLEDLTLFQENWDFQLRLSGPGKLAALRQLLSPGFSVFWCSLASPTWLWLTAWTHSALPRTSALINRQRLCFQEFQTCLDPSMPIPHNAEILTKLATEPETKCLR